MNLLQPAQPTKWGEPYKASLAVMFHFAFRGVFLLMLLSSVTPAMGRTLVVDNVAGSDRQNDRGLVSGSATFGPYRTIMRALLAARPGDTISLVKNEEPYRECVSLNGKNHSGTALYPFRFLGNGAVLDGTISPDFNYWQSLSQGIYRYEDPRFGFATLMEAGKSLTRHVDSFGDLASMKPKQWAFRNGYVYFRPVAGKSPVDHDLEVSTESVGLSLYDVEHVEILDLTVRGFCIDGIKAHDKANHVKLIGVTTRHNGRSGICVAGSSSVLIGASLSERNGKAQLMSQGTSHTELANVDLVAGDAPDIKKNGGDVKVLPNN